MTSQGFLGGFTSFGNLFVAHPMSHVSPVQREMGSLTMEPVTLLGTDDDRMITLEIHMDRLCWFQGGGAILCSPLPVSR